MRLYVCYNTVPFPLRPGGHPCRNAYRALREAGHDPEVVKSYGLGFLPGIFNRTRGRSEVKKLTGSYMVPVLVTDSEEIVSGSRRIVDWARENPASSAKASAA